MIGQASKKSRTTVRLVSDRKENRMHKMLRYCVAGTSVALCCVSAFAQSAPGSARQALNHELAALEQAGYDPGAQTARYPLDLREAQRNLAGQHRCGADAAPKTPC